MRIGAGRIAVRAVMMRGATVAGMMMLVLMCISRHFRVAQDECHTSVDRREHESRRNEHPKE